tara:strand:- start:68406 stop:68558 length:153 start_codon:yes stop_codon:yes gene_type:complete
MKKVAAVFAVVVLNLGLLSCTADSTAQDDNLYDVQACESCNEPQVKGGGN